VVSKLLQQSRRVRFKVPSTTILTTRGRRKREKKGGNDAACTLGVTGGQRGVRKGCAQEEKKEEEDELLCRKRERGREQESAKVELWWMESAQTQPAWTYFTLLGQLELPSTPSLSYIKFLSGLHITMEAGIKGRICRPGPISLVLWPEGQILDSYTYDGLYAASGDWHP
jgi:hypothetical protein